VDKFLYYFSFFALGVWVAESGLAEPGTRVMVASALSWSWVGFFRAFMRAGRLRMKLIPVIAQHLVPVPQVSLLVAMGGELLLAGRLF